MKRRQFLAAGAATAAVGGVAAPAIAQSMPEVKWRLTSGFPKSLDTIYGAAELFAWAKEYQQVRDAFGDDNNDAGAEADPATYIQFTTQLRDTLYALDAEVRDIEIDDADLVAAVNTFLEGNRDHIVELDEINGDGGDDAIRRIAPLVAEIDVSASDLFYAAALATGGIEDDGPSPAASLLTEDDLSDSTIFVSPSRRNMCGADPAGNTPLLEAGGVFRSDDVIYTQRVLLYLDEQGAQDYVDSLLPEMDTCDDPSVIQRGDEFDGGVVIASSNADGSGPASYVARVVGNRVVVAYAFVDAPNVDRAEEAGRLASSLSDKLVALQDA